MKIIDPFKLRGFWISSLKAQQKKPWGKKDLLSFAPEEQLAMIYGINKSKNLSVLQNHVNYHLIMTLSVCS